MAVMTQSGDTITFTLTQEEQQTVEGLADLGDNALEGYVTLWLEHRSFLILGRRLAQLPAQEKATVLSSLTRAKLVRERPSQA